MLTNDILAAQVSLVPPEIFLSGIPEMKQNKADSKCTSRILSHCTSLIYETSSFSKVSQKYSDIYVRSEVYSFRWMKAWKVKQCWIYLYKGNCNNDNNGLQKEWYKCVNELIQKLKEIKSLTVEMSRSLPRWYWRRRQTAASTRWWQLMPAATGWVGL